MQVKPYIDDKLHGLFATRASKRPNPIGISIVKLNKIKKNILYIKPYVSDFDARETSRIAWFAKNIHKLPNKTDDGRFITY